MYVQSSFRAVGRLARARNGKIAVAGVLAVVLLFAQTGFGHSLIKAAGLSRPTPSFVELYFPGARALPSTVPHSGVLVIRFAVGGVGGLTTRSLDWKVTEQTGKVQHELAAGRSVVAANRTATVARKIRVHCSGKRAQLVISLTHSSARITLWLACPSHR